MSRTSVRYPHLSNENLAARYLSGDSLHGISKAIGMHWGSVRRRLLNHGITIEKRHAWNYKPLPIDAIVTKYKSGKSTHELAAEYGVDCSVIASRLKEAGCKLRPRGYPSMAGQKNPMWRGGRCKLPTGYVLAYVGSGRKHHYEHRVVMEQELGRSLKRSEHVHHMNGIRDDNRPENLVVLDARAHKREGPTLVKLLQERIRELEQSHSENDLGSGSGRIS